MTDSYGPNITGTTLLNPYKHGDGGKDAECTACVYAEGVRAGIAAKPADLNKAQPKYPDSPSPDPTWRPDPDTIKVTAIEGADGRYGAVASADPDSGDHDARD